MTLVIHSENRCLGACGKSRSDAMGTFRVIWMFSSKPRTERQLFIDHLLQIIRKIMAICFASFIAESRQGVYISSSSHCCDKIPHKNNLRKGLFQLSLRRYAGNREEEARKTGR